MQTITLNEFQQAINSQGRDRIEEVTFKCPKCKTLQSAQDLINLGAGGNMDEVEKYLGFSCIGRWNQEKGCNWTLGGLFQIHECEVVTPDGKHHPRFELAKA